MTTERTEWILEFVEKDFALLNEDEQAELCRIVRELQGDLARCTQERDEARSALEQMREQVGDILMAIDLGQTWRKDGFAEIRAILTPETPAKDREEP